MANFFGGFAGGFSQGARIASEMADQRRQQEEFEHQKAEWDRIDQQRTALQAATNTLDNPNDTNGLLSPDAYKEMSAPKGKKAPKQAALPVPDVAPTPAPSPDAAVPPPAPQAAMPTPSALPPETPALSASDYHPVMVNGQVMYAPSKRIKALDGPDRVRALAGAMSSFDPVVGAQLEQSAQAIEKGNIENQSAKYGAAVMQAKRVAAVDPAKGLTMLKDAYAGLMPDLGKADFDIGKDGSITVNHYVTTQHGDQLFSTDKIPAVDPKTGLTAVDKIFLEAASYASPDAMRQHILDNSALASQVADNIYKRSQTALTDAQAQEVHPNAVSQRTLEGAQAGYYSSESRQGRAKTYYETGIDPDAPFDANVPAIMGAEGTANWDAYYGSPDGTSGGPFKAPPSPLSKMSLGDVVGWQRSQTPRVVPGSDGKKTYPAAGGLQLTSENISKYAPKLFGKDWKNQPFDQDHQIALGRAVHADQGYGAWAGLANGGLPPSPKDQAARTKAQQTQMAAYVAKWMTENNTAPPGTAEFNQNLMNAQTQAMSIYGQPTGMPEVDFQSSAKRPATAAKAPVKPAAQPAKTAQRSALPTPSPADTREFGPMKIFVPEGKFKTQADLEAFVNRETQIAQAAQGVMRLGGLVGQRQREAFQRLYRMTPEQALLRLKSLQKGG
jgi:hypothetical protein